MSASILMLIAALGMTLVLVLTGSGSVLAYSVLGVAAVISAVLYWGRGEKLERFSTNQLKAMLVVVVGIMAALMVWLLLTPFSIWLKMLLFAGLASYMTYNALENLRPQTQNIYVTVEQKNPEVNND